MKKNQIIVLIILVILIFGGIIGWAIFQKSKIPVKEVTLEEEVAEEIFSLSAKVLSVSAENNFLIVESAKEKKEIKVVLLDTTKLIKIEFPFDPRNLPEGADSTPIQTKIEISDFKEGDNIFIKTGTNIAGKTEINNVSFIHVLP